MAITAHDTTQEHRRLLAGKTCLVTGSSRGIGKQIALELGRHGADVAVNYHSSAEAASEVAETVESLGAQAITVQGDVSRNSDVDRLVDAVHDEFGPVEVLVNNAGRTADGLFESMTPEQWQEVIDVNLTGTFNCTSAFYEDITNAEEGRVINVSSVVGQQGNIGQANYAASKSGLFGLTRTLALELARSGATANCVAPGFTETDMLERVPESVQDKIRSRIPMERFARPEDIAALVRFLASDDAGYLTGQVIGVNGGMEC